ncbi:cupredoxin domain-containing protein [Granulicella sp. dw_53]|uniref:cupredoxin domain-containing protein n=1 Tax=Granulicella sp. dw_53 TaxID=2719792 RepID=UPI001BD69BAC|nr:cupredoxin domain-containing protein [Granulicella sp. dw_53]
MKSKVFAVVTFVALLVGIFAVHSSRAQQAPAPARIEITAQRFTYSPSEITAKKGVPVTIALISKDVPHGLKFSEFNFSMTAKKDKVTEATFTPDQVGTFTGQCSVFCGPGHGSMKLTLHVTE